MVDTCIITATGPSVDELDFEPLRDKVDLICVNKPYLSGMMRHWVFLDGCTADQFENQFFNNEHAHIWCTENTKRRHPLPCQTIFKRESGRGFGINLRKHSVYICGSSTFFAVQVAYLLDYKHIYLVGIDGGSVGKKMWCNGRNNTASTVGRPPGFEREASNWEWLFESKHPVVDRMTLSSSYNTRPWYNLYRNMPHKDVIQHIAENVHV
ncbi:MAG: hypothetical protein V3T31_08005 [candidate division Zixibacteria bacterium]